MSVWQAIELLNTLVDDSDPDVSPPFHSNIITCIHSHSNTHNPDYLHFRLACLRQSIYYRQRRQSGGTESQNGCKLLDQFMISESFYSFSAQLLQNPLRKVTSIVPYLTTLITSYSHASIIIPRVVTFAFITSWLYICFSNIFLSRWCHRLSF